MLITLWALCCWIYIHRVKAQYGYRAIYKNGYFVDVRPGREIASAPGGYGGTVVNRVDMKGFEDTERKGMHLLPFVDNKKIELPDTSRSRFTVGPPGIDTDIFLGRNAEQKFGITFEIIVSPGDFASKSHFKDNLICKDYISRKYVLIYATPASYVVGEENTQSEVNTLDE
ncbi:unnamed protein product [Toxocara canis]|uniref:DUF3757 domain-containing protein n=1 Tax=Toxocara canis TaxID=6265 RepID=A0A183V2Q6_TOXCA|nr:unnamed protein product [Toxocara canis]